MRDSNYCKYKRQQSVYKVKTEGRNNLTAIFEAKDIYLSLGEAWQACSPGVSGPKERSAPCQTIYYMDVTWGWKLVSTILQP
jgi:hypothetical protein